MHDVTGEVLLANRLKSTGAHVQGDERAADPVCGERIDQRLIEMKARGRRRDRTKLARKDALITLAVGRLRAPFDVGRQRHLAEALEELKRRRR